MTSTEPMTYKPGPELDARVGAALGWRCTHPHCDGVKRTICITCGTPGHGNCYGRGMGPVDVPCDHCPDYSTSWEGMRLVVSEIQRKFGGCDIGCYCSKDGSEWYTVTIVLPSGKEIIRTMNTAPHAVAEACISALQHVSNTEEDKDA